MFDNWFSPQKVAEREVAAEIIVVDDDKTPPPPPPRRDDDDDDEIKPDGGVGRLD